ncbi:chloride channel protein [Streptomyces sp. Da 82-17]|uniref:chloride channel protein n=1 Tax=Streptomyces sp. Da 82-17 TaxID=3377116 RepID=UPI0038D4A717
MGVRDEPSGPAAEAADPAQPPALRAVLASRRYRRLLALCVVVGVPIALVCFGFVGLQHELQHAVWRELPEALGFDRAPWWWPLPTLLLAGLVLAPVVTRMPGGGGHLPVNGLGGAPLGPDALPGVLIAALATLPLGVVLGPEAPLMAVGSGLALLAARAARRALALRAERRASSSASASSPGGPGGPGGGGDGAPLGPQESTLLATAGSTAAISTILGGPVAAAVLVVEGAGLAGGRLVVLLLPCLLASAAGAVVFTGFGHWTGLSIGALKLPTVPPDVNPDAGDFLWGVPLAALIALAVAAARWLGRRTAWSTRRNTALRTVAYGLAVGVCLAAYALLTGRSPEEAALSGQETLGRLAAQPHDWSVLALLALVLCKGLAWALCLGAMRGGPIFPGVLIGAALGIACSGLPGLGTTPALALGIAAATAALTGLPLTSAVLAVLLLGADASEQMPLIVTASVVAFMTAQLATRPAARGDGP